MQQQQLMFHTALLALLWVPAALAMAVSAADSEADLNVIHLNVSFNPPAVMQPYFVDNGLPWGDTTQIQVTVQLLEAVAAANTVQLSVQCDDIEVCQVAEPNQLVDFGPDVDRVEFNLTLTSLFLGRTELVLLHAVDMNNLAVLNVQMPLMRVNALRTARGAKANNLFTAFVIVFVVVNTFMMGTQLRLHIIWESVKKPIGPVIGFCCQYILMPMLAFGFSLLFLSKWPSLAFGYFTMGCSPGGGGSNFWTLLLDGNLDLSVTMTFFSNAAALFMMPAWLYTAGRYFYGGHLVLPFENIIMSLMSLIIPASVGLVVGHLRPLWVPKFKKAVKIFTIIVLVTLIVLSSVINNYIFYLLRWYTLIPGLLLPWCGYGVSYTVALLLGQSHRNCRTIAVETGIQNAAVAILVCQLSLPSPDNDLTLVMPISVLMFTGAPLWLWLAVRYARQKCCGYEDPDVLAAEEKELEALKQQMNRAAADKEKKSPPAPPVEKIELVLADPRLENGVLV